MKIRRLISSLATGVLATSILVACSSNKQADIEVSETKTSQTTEMTSKEEVASFDPSEYLTIDTSNLNCQIKLDFSSNSEKLGMVFDNSKTS